MMNWAYPIDNLVYDNVFKSFISDDFTPYVIFITHLGDVLCIIIVTIMGFLIFKDKRIGVSILVNLLIIGIFNLLLKFLLMRPRPDIFHLIDVNGYSFPSGHSMVSLAFYGYFIYLTYVHMKNKKMKWSIIIALSILIFLIGCSRIYLGVHFATDVMGGFCFSLFYLFIYIGVVKRVIK